MKRIMHNCFLYGRQGHTSRGPVTVWPRTGDSGADFGDREPLRVRGGYVAGPWRLRCRSGKCLGTGDGRVHEGPKSVAGPGGKCGPGTVWSGTGDGTSQGPATGKSTCKDIESQVAGKAVAGPNNAWGPGTAECTRGRKASQVPEGNADLGRHGQGPATAPAEDPRR